MSATSTATTADTSARRTPPTAAVPRLALAVTGVLLTGNAVALAPQLFFDSRAYSAIAAGPLHLFHYVIWTGCLVALSQLYPMLAGLRGRTGRGLPPALLRLAGIGAALAACAAFVNAFVSPYLADHQPALLDTTPDAILLVPLLAASAAGMLATAAIGVVGAVRKVLPLPAAVMLVLGGLLVPVIGPMANLLGGLGLVLTAWRAGSREPV